MKSTYLIKLLPVTVASLLLSLGISSPSFANNVSSDGVRQGLPGRRISGGVRMEPPADSCFSDFNQSLVSIMPRNNLGTTSESHPTFWFSMPETSGEKAVEFQLMNESDDLIYTAQVNVSDAAGLSEFKLPDSAPALAMNENYKWVFSMACNNGSRSPVLALQGWVRRVEIAADVSAQIMAASPEDQIALYRSAGLWHEQISTLLNLRRQSSEGMALQIAWSDLMASTGLTSEVSDDVLDQMSVVTPSVDTVTLSSF